MTTEGVGCLVILGVAALVVAGFSGAADGERVGYARGYCRALDAAVVADSLCVRGDSIVAHIKEAK
jgi:hypothetical protein